MASEAIFLELFFVAIGMVAFSMLLNRILGLRPEAMKQFREKVFNLQERIKQAQLIGDPQLMQEIQFESMQIMKEMMKKQLLPMCLRCFIFIGILIVLNIVYADYISGLLPFPILFFGDGWFAVYFLYALALGLSIFAIKRLYYKATGKQPKRKRMAQDMMGGLQMPGRGGLMGSFQVPRTPEPSYSTPSPIAQAIQEEKEAEAEQINAWKNKIQKDEEQ